MTKKWKSASYGYKATHLNSYPADGFYYALCDICGRKMRVNQMKMTYGTRGTLLVCPNDYEDPHPQDYIKSFKERPAPKLTRSESTDSFEYINTAAEIESGNTSDPTGRAPGAPTNLSATAGNPDLSTTGDSTNTIHLQWDMNQSDPGSSAIQGFKIERESPEGGGFSTIVSNTSIAALYYIDTGLSSGTEYNYRVSAINAAGTGNASNEAKDTTD